MRTAVAVNIGTSQTAIRAFVRLIGSAATVIVGGTQKGWAMAGDIIELVLLLGALGMNVYVAVDARATPVEVFEAVGRSRTAWMTLSLVGAFMFIFGIATAGYYVLLVRPQLRREIAAGGLEDRVSGRTKVVQYLLPALAIATAAALSSTIAGRS
jgi:hypothetical protein